MGFTKKSLLALVLALVMVLGMAVPTAFAVPSATGAAITFKDAAGTTITAAKPLTLTLDDDPAKIDLFDGATTPMTNYYLGGAPKVEFSEVDPAITPEIGGDGFITVKPNALNTSATNVTFRVKVSAPTTADWGQAGGWANANYYTGLVNVKIMPTIKANDAINLDVNPLGGHLTQVLQFTANPAKAYEITSAALTNGAGLTSTISADKQYVTLKVTIATAPKAAKLTVKGTVDGQAFKDLVIDFNLVDSTSGKMHHVAVSDASFTVNRNDPTLPYFTVTVQDATNTTVAPATVAAAGAYTLAEITATSDDPTIINVDGSISTATVKAFKLDFTGATEAGGETDIIVTMKNASNEEIISAKVHVVVTPLKATVGTTSVGLDLDKRYVATLNKDKAVLTISSDAATMLAPLSIGFPTASNGAASVSAIGNTITIQGLTKGSGFVTVPNIKVGSIPVEDLKVNYTVIDSTPIPEITANPTSVVIDKATASTATVNFTASGSYLTGAAANTRSNVVVAYATAEEPKIFGTIPAVVNNAADVTKASVVLTAGSIVGKAKLKVTGKVDGVDITPYTIDAEVKNSTAGAASKIIVDTASINEKVSKGNITLTAKVVDYLDAALTTQPNMEIVLVNDPDLTAPQNILTLPAPSTNTTGVFTIATKTSGKATLKIGSPTVATSTVPVVEIPVVLDPMALALSSKSITLDLKDADSMKSAITISSADGTVTAVTITEPTAAPLNPTDLLATMPIYVAGSGKFEIAAHATSGVLGKGKVLVNGLVNGFAFEQQTIDVEVVNTLAIKADKDIYEFDMKVGGKRTDEMTLSTNLAVGAMSDVTVVSNDTSLLTVARQTTGADFTKWDLKALEVGEGTLTINGKVGGRDVTPVVVKFKAIDSSNKQDITVTPAGALALQLNDETKKAATLTFAGPLSTNVVEIVSITPSNDSVEVTGNGLTRTVTGVKVGVGTLTVKATIDGNEANDKVINYTVTDGAVVTGDFLVNDVAGTAGSLFVRNSVANNQYKLTLNGYTGSVTWKSSNKAILKFIDAPAGKASSTKTGTEVQWVQVLKAGTVKVTATPATGTAKSISFTIKAEAETGFTVGDQALLVGQRASAKPEIVPATAKTKGFKFKSSDKKVVTVSSKGILVAKKAGTATITVTPKKKGLAKQTFTVTVTVDYKNLNYNSVVLLQNSDGKPNADADNVKKIFESARFDASGNAAGANILAATATKADVKAAIATMALASKNTSDISNFYFAGAATKTGLTFTDGEYSYTDLANDLAKCTGNVVVFLDCTGGNRLINAKAASDADVFAAFSKAVKPGLSTMTNSAVEKLSFTVFTSTAKAKTTVTPTVSADGSSVQYKFTKLFAETLKVSDSNTISVGTNGIVNVKQLWAKLKAAKGSVWASKKSVMPIYGYVPAAPVTP